MIMTSVVVMMALIYSYLSVRSCFLERYRIFLALIMGAGMMIVMLNMYTNPAMYTAIYKVPYSCLG